MPEYSTYDVGDVVRLSFTSDVADVATDPTTLALRVRNPSGVVTEYTWAGAQIVKDSTGRFHYDLTVNAPGWWLYRFVATGAAAGASADTELFVRTKAFV